MTSQEQERQASIFTQKMMDTLISKRGDYSSGDNQNEPQDALSNFKLVAQIVGITPEQVITTLIGVKTVRLGNLLRSGKVPNNESINDTLLDLANYAVLLHMVKNEFEPSDELPF